jgi:RimJ/RimL family protein N-acetyltransferase
MTHAENELGQPIGLPLPGWVPPPPPPRTTMEGRLCRLEPLVVERHGDDLYETIVAGKGAAHWTYLPYGPFASVTAFREWLTQAASTADPLFFSIVGQASGQALGLAAYLRITPESGAIEVGHLSFGRPLERTPAATEAMYMMMKRAFELGYRRYEWKCDALNAASRHAAERLGFRREGIFRQATVYKGRSRDTAWYSVIDGEWPLLQDAFERWLSPDNFDAHGRQRTSLRELGRSPHATEAGTPPR